MLLFEMNLSAARPRGRVGYVFRIRLCLRALAVRRPSWQEGSLMALRKRLSEKGTPHNDLFGGAKTF